MRNRILNFQNLPKISVNRQNRWFVSLEKKGRNGKPVTLIEGFLGTEDELKKISKKIKSELGIGGSEKDGIIIIQGNNRDKIMAILQNLGYKTKRVGG